eukprot:12405273-Karenia_brevis.AAC.1
MTVAAHLRHLVACKFADMEPEQLLNEIRTFLMLERQEEWQDLWSPVDMLNRNNFAFWNDAQIDVVVGVEDSVAGND